MSECECGCGRETSIAKETNRRRGQVKGQPFRFVHGHNARGSNSSNWNGGRQYSRGYLSLLLPGHPRANPRGYVLEHISIAERAIGQPLPSGAVVHHVNEIKDDNRHENLVICESRAYHLLLHQRMRAYHACGDANARKCSFCGVWWRDAAGRVHHPSCRSANNRKCLMRRAREAGQKLLTMQEPEGKHAR